MQAMLFAAGLGTRLRPLTDHTPKALVRVNGQPLLDIAIKKLRDNGCKHIVVNVHHFSQQITDYLAQHDWGLKVEISDESRELLDTGGGLRKALPLFSPNAPILIHNVDILSNANLQQFYQENATNDATLLVSQRKTQRYLLFNPQMQLVGWTNIATGEVRSPHKNLRVDTCKMYAFSGIHIVRPDTVAPILATYPKQFPIMDFYLQHCHEINIKGVQSDKLELLDVGKQETLEAAETFLKNLA